MSAEQPEVLVAEDDPVFRHLMKFSITKAGYRVIAVGDGEAAWQQLQQRTFAALVTDHQMPHCSGLELLERMREAPSAMGEMPAAILCTAKGLEIDREKIRREYNLLAVMGKPFSPKQLVQQLNQHCRSQSPTNCEVNVRSVTPELATS